MNNTTWYDHWKNKNLTVDVEPTTYCNAACPQCHRTDQNTLKTAEWLTESSWTLEDFKQMFPVEAMEGIKVFNMHGTYGDPMMCKDLVEICDYIIQNSNSWITINTNGSMRSNDFWWNLGTACGERLHIVFAVDGIDQEMHSKYRRNTELKKVLENMETISATKALVTTYTVIFKHNQDHWEEIKQLCIDHGASDCMYFESNRFNRNTGDSINYGDFTLEKATKAELKVQEEEHEQEFIKILSNDKRSEVQSAREETYEITCAWAKKGSVFVTQSTRMWPCCYLATTGNLGMDYPEYTQTNMVQGKIIRPLNQNTFYDYYHNREKFMLKHTSFLDIIKSDFWTKGLFESFEDGKNTDSLCKMFCGKKCSN